ncbi:ras-related protein Rab-17 isoform X2 [Elephas maximus indicus]|uniref:ras-related protein Rab-17 isoform X2 n=1 Tax=Elephas maximus indicus TaxID=99487 RepID=UPI002116DEB6|nr:ras-related protein Rab-17 isoform X2 [Elephas maximus indicus]
MAQKDTTPPPGAALRPPRVFKLVLLGSGSVGKSSLALRYVKNDFKSILPTVGCAFFTKVVHMEAASLKFEIWDTAGQEKYHSVCHLYLRGANAALLVYDITSKEGKEFAESKKLLFMETSAKLNHQVTEAFSAVARELLQREETVGPTQKENARVALNEGPPRQVRCCAH